MRLVVEQSDIAEVRDITENYLGVYLKDGQIEKIITENKNLSHNLYFDGGLDTCGRELVAHCVVELVMCKCSPPKNHSYWHWPMGGSKKEYKKEFVSEFKKEAKKIGITIEKDWDKLIIGK